MKKQFKINQSVLWIVNDFDGRMVTNAKITEVHDNHCIAKSDDNMTLWIDSDNEMEFFETDIMEKVFSLM
jgi:hypothetical protein